MGDYNVFRTTPVARIEGISSEVTEVDEFGNVKTTSATKISGEDFDKDVMKVEQRFNGVLVTADSQVKNGAGFLHALTFSCNDAAPTAGSIIVYNSLTEAGTQLFNHAFTTTPFIPFTVTLDMDFSTGLYIGFSTTNDVNVSVSYN